MTYYHSHGNQASASLYKGFIAKLKLAVAVSVPPKNHYFLSYIAVQGWLI